MEIPYRKPLSGLLAGHFWHEASGIARAAYLAANSGVQTTVAKIDSELGKEIAWHDADSLHAYREQIAINAASYLRAIQFCQLFGHFEWALGLLCNDVQHILGAEKLASRGVSKLKPKWYALDRLEWLREALPAFESQNFKPELKRVAEVRNAFLHDGGQVTRELNQDRFEHVTAFIAEQPSVAQIVTHELQLADPAMPYFEKWFGDAFDCAHGKVIEALNGMDWSIPTSPSHQEMREQFGRLVNSKAARKAESRQPQSVKCVDGSGN